MPPGAALEGVDDLGREGDGGRGRVHVEEEPAAGTEGRALRQDEEGHAHARPPRQPQRGEIDGPGSSREDRLEGDGVQALLRRAEEGVGARVGTRAGHVAAEASPSGLGGLDPGEVDPDGELPGEDERSARGVVAQGQQLEGEGLVLALEALAGETGLHAGEDAAGESQLGLPAARLHGAVAGDDGLGVSDRRGEEAGEEAVLARLDRADPRLTADEAVEPGALQEAGPEPAGRRGSRSRGAGRGRVPWRRAR